MTADPSAVAERLRVAVVGGGIVGLDHAAAYQAQPDAELVAVLGRDVHGPLTVAAAGRHA